MSYVGYQSTNNGDSNDFNRLASKISLNTQKISQNVYAMQKIVNQIGTSSDNESLRCQLREIQDTTNELVRSASDNIKELKCIPYPMIISEQKQRKMNMEKISKEFYDVLKNYKVIQQTSISKQRDSVSRARNAAGIKALDPPAGKFLIDLNSSSPPNRTTVAQETINIQEEGVNIEDLRQREAEIRRLEDEIKGVNSIFNDLASIVHDQSEIIDSIEANVEEAHMHVADGASELQKASEYQRRARYRMFWMILIASIIAAFLFIVVWKT